MINFWLGLHLLTNTSLVTLKGRNEKLLLTIYGLPDLPALKTKTFKNGYKCLVHKRLYYLVMHTENIQKSAWPTSHAVEQSSLYNK